MSENCGSTPVARSSRRALLAAGAWATPVVVVATPVPAFAASACDTGYAYRLDWGTSLYTRTVDRTSGTAIVEATGSPVGAVPVAVTFLSTSGGSTRSTNNLNVSTTANLGNLGNAERGLLIDHGESVAGRDGGQTVVISFSRPATDLSLWITDIDSNNDKGTTSDFTDQVELSPAPGGSTRDPNIDGGGVAGNPWRINNDDLHYEEYQDGARVYVTYASATATTLRYWNSRGSSQQRIILADFTFTALGC